MAKAKKHQKDYEHEMNLAVMKAFAADPELKYYMGVAAGAGVAWVGTLLGQQTEADYGNITIGQTDTGVKKPSLPPWMWLASPAIAINTSIADKFTNIFGVDAIGGATDPTKALNDILVIGGTGFAGFCASVLLLKAASGGSEGGILGKLAGAIA